PPLRERVDDLPALVAALLEELCARQGRRPPPVPPRAMARLRAHAWPGNIRELRNVLEQALVMSHGAAFELPARLTRRAPGPAARVDGRALEEDVPESLEAATRRCIERALRACEGKIYGPGGAAERLELKPGTLQSKMRKLGVERRAFVRRAGR
ncbi:MAG: AAA family ATPase, partial [Myxococcales bacterium]|nr:AAA family ATPase [Myxococcales bacterium]